MLMMLNSRSGDAGCQAASHTQSAKGQLMLMMLALTLGSQTSWAQEGRLMLMMLVFRPAFRLGSQPQRAQEERVPLILAFRPGSLSFVAMGIGRVAVAHDAGYQAG